MIENGQVINGKYRLNRLLGDGGMGSVYEARHEGLGTRVAIKVLHADLARRPGLVERFLREARVSAQIRSPNVVQVTDVDRTAQGDAFIVMELLEGEPLSSLLERERRVPIPTACDYTKQILQALEAAHALGVVHRDLKPENVFITYVAGQPLLKLIDFGIAKAHLSEPTTRNLTVAGVVMGTAEYMAPEQAHSADKVNARSDLYAVGVMLYEMIAGVRPVSGEDARIVALKVERGEVRPLVHAMPDVPRELAGLVHRAMAARAELRFASATEMRLALEAVSKSPSVPVAQPQQPQTQRQPQGTGTVLGAPVFSTPAPLAAAQLQERTSPGGTPGALVGAPPYGAPAATSPARARPRRRRWTLWVPIAFLVGVAAVIGIWAMNANDNGDSGSARPTAVIPTTKGKPGAAPTGPVVDTAVPIVDTAVPVVDTVAPLTTTTPNTTASPHPRPHPTSSASGRAAPPSVPEAGANTGTTTSPFPPGFPTSLPIPFPTAGGSGMGPVIPIPSLPFSIPGLPTAPPGAAPSADPPAPTGTPRYQ